MAGSCPAPARSPSCTARRAPRRPRWPWPLPRGPLLASGKPEASSHTRIPPPSPAAAVPEQQALRQERQPRFPSSAAAGPSQASRGCRASSCAAAEKLPRGPIPASRAATLLLQRPEKRPAGWAAEPESGTVWSPLELRSGCSAS